MACIPISFRSIVHRLPARLALIERLIVPGDSEWEEASSLCFRDAERTAEKKKDNDPQRPSGGIGFRVEPWPFDFLSLPLCLSLSLCVLSVLWTTMDSDF